MLIDLPNWALPVIITSSIIVLSALGYCCYVYYKRHATSANKHQTSSISTSPEIALITLPQTPQSTSTLASTTPSPIELEIGEQKLPINSWGRFYEPIDENDEKSDSTNINDFCLDPIRETGRAKDWSETEKNNHNNLP